MDYEKFLKDSQKRINSQKVKDARIQYEKRKSEENQGGFLGGVGYTLEKVAIGLTKSAEGITDLVVGGVADLLGADEFAKEQFENDWFGDWYSHPDEWYNPDGVMSFVGDIGYSVGNMAPAIAAAVATQGASIPVTIATVATGVSSAGNAVGDVVKETGELNSDAYLYGALVGATEILTEKASGKLLGTGLEKIGKTASKKMIGKAGTSIAKQVAVDLGKEFVSEAFEEGVAEFMTPIYKRITYDPNAKMASAKDVAYAALVGGTTGMLVGGGTSAFSAAHDIARGNKIAESNRVNGVLETTRLILDGESNAKSKDPVREFISKTYAELGKIDDVNKLTAGQKIRLAQLERANSMAIMTPHIYKSAANILNNADAVLARLNSYGYKNMDGSSITITKEDLTKGVDFSDPKTIATAIQENDILRNLAVSNFAGKLIMDSNTFANATLEGKNYATADDLTRFVKESEPETLKKVSKALNITPEEWYSMTPELFAKKMEEFKNSAEGRDYIERAEKINEAKKIPESEAKEKLPLTAKTQPDGSIQRYRTGKINIAIIKENGTYAIYDYDSRIASRRLSLSEVQNTLEELRTMNENDIKGALVHEGASQIKKSFDNAVVSEKYKKAERFARQNIPEYSELVDSAKRAIEHTVVEGWAKGLNEEEILIFAKFSAKTGINVAFDETKLITGRDKNGNLTYADGMYDGDNTIIINKNSKRKYSSVIFHELMHYFYKNSSNKQGIKLTKHLMKTAVTKMPESKFNEIRERYLKYYTDDGKKEIDSVSFNEVLIDEITAHYAEDLLSNIDVMAFLETEQPGLIKRIISFFYKSAQRHSGEQRLSAAARKYIRTFKQLTDEVAKVNKNGNSVANMSSLKEQSAKKRLALKNKNKKPIDLENFDLSCYNEITLDGAEYSRLHSEALTWGAKIRNELTTRTLSNGVSYCYILDNDAMLHVFDKEKAVNIHERRVVYDKRNRMQFDRDLKGLRIGQRYDGSDFDSLQNGRESSINDRGDNGSIRGEGGSYQGGRAQNSVNLKRNPKTGVQTPFLRVVHTFTDYTGRKRNVIKVDEGKYMIEGDSRSKYQPTIEAAVAAENKRIIQRYARKNDRSPSYVIEKLKKEPNFLKGFRFALSEDGIAGKSEDSVTISKGVLQKQKANYNSDKVYSKKEVVTSFDTVAEMSYLPQETRERFLNDVWKGLNSHYGKDSREMYVESMSKELIRLLETEALPEDKLNELKLLKSARKRAEASKSDTKDKRIKDIDTKINAILTDSPKLMDDYSSYEVRNVEDSVFISMYTLLEKGEESTRARMQNEFDSSSAGYWKNRYSESVSRNRVIGLLMNKAQRLKDIKLGTYSNATQAESTDFNKIIGSLARIEFRGNLNVTGTRKILRDLLKWYNPDNPILKNSISAAGESSGTYEAGIADMVSDLALGEGGFTVSELQSLYDVMSYFEKFALTYGKVFRKGKWVDALPLATEYVNKLKAIENVNSNLARRLVYSYSEKFGDPETVVKMMDRYTDGGFFTEMFFEIREAVIGAKKLEFDLKSRYDEFLSKNKSYIKKATNETVTFNGVEIPRIKAIGLYMTLKREHSHKGFLYNGFSFLDKNKNKKVHVSALREGTTELNELEILDYTKGQISKLEALFNTADKEYISILEEVYNGKAKELKKSRDIQRLGFSNVSESYYYPIRRAGIFKSIDSTDIAEEIDHVKNSSFNKNIVQNAAQELYIEDADLVFNRHIRAITQYYSLTPVVELYDMIYNLDVSGNKNKPVSVNTVGENVWSGGNGYLKALIADAQGIPRSSDKSAILEKIRSNYAKFQLGANPKVLLTQGSSLFAATSILDADCVAKSLAKSGKDVTAYSELAKIRSSDNHVAKAQGVIDKMEGVSNFLSAGIGKTDDFIISRLFVACQYQVKKDGGAKVGTEENKKAAAELLERVIVETQQNAFVTERSAAMRSSSEFYRTVTMFSADSMKVLGRVVDSFGEYLTLKTIKKDLVRTNKNTADIDSKIKASKRKVRKSLGAMLFTAAYMAGLAELFKLLYNKERDEDESITQTFVLDMFGNMLGGLPLIRDVYSYVVDGFEMDSYSYSVLNDLLTSSLNVFEGLCSMSESPEDAARALKNLVFSVGQVCGIPTRNIYNLLYGLTKRISPNTAYKIDGAFNKQNYQNDLKKAIEKNDVDRASMLLSMLYNERTNEEISQSVHDELFELTKQGYNVIPRIVPETVTINNEEIPLSPEQQEQFRTLYVQYNQALERLISNSDYKKFSPQQRAKAIKYIYELYYDYAGETLFMVDFDKKTKMLYAFDSTTISILKVLSENIESDKDSSGKTIRGSKRSKILKLIRQLNITKGEQLLLLSYFGYSVQDGDFPGVTAERAKKYLLQYIMSLKGTSKEQKIQLLELCNFKVENGKVLMSA